MYIPAYFEETRTEILQDFISKNPFGILCTNGNGGLDANHLPFLLEPIAGNLGKLHCHVARANPVWRNVANGNQVLAIFRGGDAYISPNWYPSKQETHQQVPTWNYMVTHAYGRVAVRDEESYLRNLVAKLTEVHEASEPVPWRIEDGEKSYIDAMLKSIVGLEIEITRLTGKFKLSQNKESRDIRGARDALTTRKENRIANAMLGVADQKPNER